MENMENVPVSIRKTPDGKFYQAGFEIHGAFQPFTFAEWPASSWDANLAEAQKAEQESQAAQQTPPPQ